ncbi:MAG: LamG domain-containing protein [Desulfobacteraceae bacterium]|nr:LamG domain-containing protein [Desulfobacteraceae bacterium]
MLDYIKKLITPDMVSLWVPSGLNRAQDLIRGNHGQCYGTHPNVPVIGVPYTLNTCDAMTDWTTQNGSLSIDATDKKEGMGSLKDNVASPAAGSLYYTGYDPAGAWDWSAKKYILFWFKCDRASTAFDPLDCRLILRDTSNNWRVWDLTFSAGEWTAFKFLLSTGDNESGTPPDLASVDTVRVRLKTIDTTPFYKKIDDLRIAYSPSLINPSVGWHFDGVDDKVSADGVIADVDLTTTGKVTLCGWFKRTAASGTSFQGFMVDTSLDNDLLIIFDDTSVFAEMRGGGGTYPTVTDNTDYSGEWVHICVVKDGEDLELFVNGVSKGKDDTTGLDADVVVTSFDIGWAHSDLYAFDGYIALPFVANKAWSIAQIKNFYNATKGLFYPRG